MGTQPQSGPIQVPNPSDTRLHFESYQNAMKMLNQMRGMTVGNTREVVNDMAHVKLSSVVADAITGDEVTWDYAAEEWVTMDGGREFDGTEFPYLIPANGNWLPAVGDVVVVYEVIDNTDAESRWIFYPLAKLNNSFVPSIDEADNTLLRIQTGTVYLNEEDDGTDVTDGTGFSLSSDAYLVVKWTMPLSDGTAVQTPTVTTTVQTESVEPNFIDIGASEVTFKWVIGQILSDEYTSWWWGDIHHNFPCTPQYHDDVQTAGDDQSVDLFAVSEATTISQTSGIVNFLEGRIVGHQFKVGDLFNIVDNGSGSNEYQFGGKSTSVSDNTMDIDDSTENEIKFTTRAYAQDTTAGLTQELTLTDNTDDLIKFLGKWVGKEADGVIKHLDSPATSTSDDEHWKEFQVNITGGIVIDGSSAVDTLTVRVDNKGHIWEINGVQQPGSTDNYRYSPCPGVSGSDIIVSATQGTIVELDNKCYTSVGTTEEALTSPAPSVGNTFTTCASCTSSQSNEIWRDCPSPGTTDYVVQGTPSSDIAPALWGCVTSAWKKMYYDNRMSSNTATVTDFLAQCGTTAEDCDDLVGWPGSDDFGGSGCNSGEVNDTNYDVRWSETKVGSPVYSVSSGALNVEIPDPNEGIPASDNFNGSGTDSGSVGDTNWNTRWTRDNTKGTLAISGNQLNMAMSVGGSNYSSRTAVNDLNHSGDFTNSVDYSLTTFDNQGSQHWVGIEVIIGGTFYSCKRNYDSIDGVGYRCYDGTGYTNVATSDTSDTLVLERSGNTLTCTAGSYGTVWSVTVSGNLTEAKLHWRCDTGTINVDLDNFVLEEDSETPILVGSGGAPTESSLTLANNIPAQSGDFLFEVVITVDSVTGAGQGPGLYLAVDGSTSVGYFQNNEISGWGYQEGGLYTLVTTGIGTKTVAIERTGSTLKIYISGVVEFTGTLTGSKKPSLTGTNDNNTVAAVDGISGSFDDVETSSNPSSFTEIYIDPTGDPCP